MKIDTFRILLGLGRHTKYNTSKLLHGNETSIAKKKYLFWKQYDEFLEENKWLKDIEYNELVPQDWRNINEKEPNASLPIDLYLELHMNYPVPIPYPLFFISDNYKIERIGDKWLRDIFSGESFYKLNKEYFTRSEAKQFLTCDWLQLFDEQRIYPATYLDLIDSYFYAKIKANNLTLPNYVFTDPFKSCFTHKIVQEYFQFICNNRKHFNDEEEVENIGEYLKSEYINNKKDLDFKEITWQDLKKNYKYYALDILNGVKYKFENCFTHKIVQEYLKFIDNNLYNIRNKDEIKDIGDFLKSEYINNGQDFDFNGRTWQGLRRLSDEWHALQTQKKYQGLSDKRWEKSTINDFIYKKDGKTWTIKEITSEKLLHDEGETMEHCVYFHLNDCIDGNCFIFSVSCTSEELEEKVATVEISKNFELIEARGKRNSKLSAETINIIEKWTNKNKIFYGEIYNTINVEHNEDYFNKILNEKNKIDGKIWTLNSIEKNRKYWYYANKYGKAYSNYNKPEEKGKLISLKSSDEKEIILIISDTGSIINCFDTEYVSESQMKEKNNILREWLENKGIYSSGFLELYNYNDNYDDNKDNENDDCFYEDEEEDEEDDEDEDYDDEEDDEE